MFCASAMNPASSSSTSSHPLNDDSISSQSTKPKNKERMEGIKTKHVDNKGLTVRTCNGIITYTNNNHLFFLSSSNGTESREKIIR